ncbi:hypothetical protein ACOME3_006072 [Neoechinorhynchus agilis]
MNSRQSLLRESDRRSPSQALELESQIYSQCNDSGEYQNKVEVLCETLRLESIERRSREDLNEPSNGFKDSDDISESFEIELLSNENPKESEKKSLFANLCSMIPTMDRFIQKTEDGQILEDENELNGARSLLSIFRRHEPIRLSTLKNIELFLRDELFPVMASHRITLKNPTEPLTELQSTYLKIFKEKVKTFDLSKFADNIKALSTRSIEYQQNVTDRVRKELENSSVKEFTYLQSFKRHYDDSP